MARARARALLEHESGGGRPRAAQQRAQGLCHRLRRQPASPSSFQSPILCPPTPSFFSLFLLLLSPCCIIYNTQRAAAQSAPACPKNVSSSLPPFPSFQHRPKEKKRPMTHPPSSHPPTPLSIVAYVVFSQGACVCLSVCVSFAGRARAQWRRPRGTPSFSVLRVVSSPLPPFWAARGDPPPSPRSESGSLWRNGVGNAPQIVTFAAL